MGGIFGAHSDKNINHATDVVPIDGWFSRGGLSFSRSQVPFGKRDLPHAGRGFWSVEPHIPTIHSWHTEHISRADLQVRQ